MKRISLFLAICLVSLSSFAQSADKGLIKGQILNATNNEAFSMVNVAVFSLPDSVLVTGSASNDAGYFELKNIEYGTYLLKISFVGYDTREINCELSSLNSEFDAGIITLRESAQKIGDVEIVTAKPEIIYKEGKKILNVDQFKSTGATNLVEVLENAPSITTDTEGNVLLRGSASYKLLIDGKPAPVTGGNLLRQIPQEMVENIEIITNPSAKYEAEGAAGIINLILKKQSEAGFNSLLTLLAGWNNKYNGDVQFNYRKNKLNMFGGVSGTSYNTDVAGDLNRTSLIGGKDFEYNTYLVQTTTIGTISGNLGLDYDLNDKNNISASSNFGPMRFDIGLNNKVFRGFTEDGVDEKYLATNSLLLDGFFVNPKVGWLHKFDQDGHQIDINIFAGGFQGDLLQDRNEYLVDDNWGNVQDVWMKSNSSEKSLIKDARLKVDYEKPFGENKLEMGTQLSRYVEDNKFVLNDYDFDQDIWIKNTGFSNDATLNRDIYAGYAIWSGPLKGLHYSLGLRAEYTDRLIAQVTTDEEYAYSKLGLFPSGSLSKTLKGGQQLQFSFSRRINRPNRQFLNPFPQFIDNQTVRAGNPDLKPEFVNSFELSFQQPVKIGMFSVETYYRQANDLTSQVFSADDEGNMFFGFENANQSHSAGAEFMGNLGFTKWFRLVATGNVYYYSLVDERMADLDNTSLQWSTRVNTMFMFGSNSRLTFSGVYTGPTLMLQGRMAGTFMLNAGFTQTFLKRAASLTLGVRDMLSTYRIQMETFSPGLEVLTDLRPESPVITLTLTYNFNNYQRRTPDEEAMDLNFIR